MKFAALLSGGKDSIYSIQKAIDFGHQLVCVVNLFPADESIDELNSFMYQTAAHTAISMQADCLGVPLIRRVILGSASCQALDYVPNAGDEVEDLYEAILEAIARFPDVQAINCGAIISNYQRTRVENICVRLGLQSLAYLWERDRSELLHEMLAAGIEAVLVKVASAGLDPQLHLGRTLSDMLPVIERMHKKFGLDMCGEGGEYESLVVDCRLFKKRLVLDETQVVVDEEDSSVGNLRIIRCSCQEKVMSDPSCIPVSPPTPQLNEPLKVTDARVVSLSMPSLVIRSRLVQSSLMFPQPNGDAELRPDLAVANQLQALFSGLKSQLSQRGCELGDAVFVHLFLSGMSLFDQVNTEYSKHFHHRPASRSCIAVPLPAGVYVAMDVTLLCGSHDLKPGDSLRRVLHIRSRSQWAPQCIGPYSQANLLFGSIALVAGQIALNPTTMCVWPASSSDTSPTTSSPEFSSRVTGIVADHSCMLGWVLCMQLALSIRNAHRVLLTLGSCCSSALSCLVYVVEGYSCEYACVKTLVSQLILALASEGDLEEESDSDSHGPETRILLHAPVLVVVVKDLPRGALVEIEMVARTALVPEDLMSSLSFSKSEKDYTKDIDDMREAVTGNADLFFTSPMFDDIVSHQKAVDLFNVSVAMLACRYCVCAGSAVVDLTAEQDDEAATVESAFTLLCLGIRDSLKASGLPHRSILSLRVFYNSRMVDRGTFSFIAGQIVNRIFGALSVPTLLVPLVAMTAQKTIVSCQFLAIDQQQLNSEIWIRCK